MSRFAASDDESSDSGEFSDMRHSRPGGHAVPTRSASYPLHVGETTSDSHGVESFITKTLKAHPDWVRTATVQASGVGRDEGLVRTLRLLHVAASGVVVVWDPVSREKWATSLSSDLVKNAKWVRGRAAVKSSKATSAHADPSSPPTPRVITPKSVHSTRRNSPPRHLPVTGNVHGNVQERFAARTPYVSSISPRRHISTTHEEKLPPEDLQPPPLLSSRSAPAPLLSPAPNIVPPPQVVPQNKNVQ